MQSLCKLKLVNRTVVELTAPYIHSLKGESACHLIHLEWDLERDPDLELDELLDRDLKDKKTEPFQYSPYRNIARWFTWQSTSKVFNCT